MRYLTNLLTALLCLVSLTHVISVSDTLTISKNDATIDEPDYYNLVNDAVRLKKAMRGWGTDEAEIIDILTHRYNYNRQEIVQSFKVRYDDDLWKEIRSETSGDFRYSLKPLVLTESQFLAEDFRNAMNGAGTNENTLINILMMVINEPNLLQAIKNDYKTSYNEDLLDRFGEETDGEFLTFLTNIVNRPVFSADVDSEIVGIDVSNLRQAIDTEDIDRITSILTGRSTAHIKSISEEYYQATGLELEVALDDITSHHLHDGLLSLVSVSRNYYVYLAYELYHAMDGWGTDEDALTRIIGTRADKDLSLIKESYQDVVGRSLKDDIDDDTSGDYRKVLLALIN